jgi:hypothetical protein
VSHLLLLFLACSSDCAGRMPGAQTQSKLPIEIVAENRQTSSHVCKQPQTHAFRSGFEGANVGAGCSCHPTSSHHLRSIGVPLHPVWPRPVARFSGAMSLDVVAEEVATSLPYGEGATGLFRTREVSKLVTKR